MRPATTSVELHAHLAAAVYLMRRAHATELVVVTNDASRRPVAIITDTNIARAVADGNDINETCIDDLLADGRLRTIPELV
jgi:CBS domain-containing protein